MSSVYGDSSRNRFVLRNFPFDEQEFDVTLVAAGHTPDEVRLVQDPERAISHCRYRPPFSGGLDGDLVENYDGHVYGPLRQVSPMTAFTFHFEAKRGTRYFFLAIIIPLTLIVAMSWVVFWIDPKESGTQIGVAMTSMLTLIAYRFAVASHLPKISYMTLIDIFLLGATLLVFASLAEVIDYLVLCAVRAVAACTPNRRADAPGISSRFRGGICSCVPANPMTQRASRQVKMLVLTYHKLGR